MAWPPVDVHQFRVTGKSSKCEENKFSARHHMDITKDNELLFAMWGENSEESVASIERELEFHTSTARRWVK